ncbi:hypothetical protein [Rhodococcus sp. NPDC049939]|uniref:WXG100 family type VII secretion target n=1 Tax=Rhodococcus sp. NPDC049939 TaxID=3155511 RepID=UPI0033FF8800
MNRENFQSSDWDHRAIKSAVDSLAPAESETVAARWDHIGHRFQESITTFHDEIRSAIDDGWRGTTAAAVGSAIDEYTSRARQVGDQFSDVGGALRHAMSGAEAVRGAVVPPIDHTTDWTRVLPWNWTGEADADAAEQNAKAAMETLYTPAYQGASEHLPVLQSTFPNNADRGLDAAATNAAAAPQPVGFDVGPNGTFGVPDDRQLAGNEESRESSSERGHDDGPRRESPDEGIRSSAPDSIANAALAGAVGGGIAKYAQHVVASHRSPPASPPPPKDHVDGDDAEEEPPTFLEDIDEGSELVGRLPLVAPSVIGK